MSIPPYDTPLNQALWETQKLEIFLEMKTYELDDKYILPDQSNAYIKSAQAIVDWLLKSDEYKEFSSDVILSRAQLYFIASSKCEALQNYTLTHEGLSRSTS